MTARERRQRTAKLLRWFALAAEQEKLQARPKAWTKYMQQHPTAGLITADLLYDLFLLATDRS